ncbi:MAG: MHYT domain-containing protein [Aliishimia sp.]
MLEHGHNHLLVIASLAIALMSGFTGLSLTRGASTMPTGRRKLVVSMAAVALGSGIWSMHFVAMLGMTLPVPFHYDALITLISALAAILLTGVALLIVHFGDRTPLRITFAGVCVGLGVVAMHYIGMSGIQDVRAVYSPLGVASAFGAALVLCVSSFWISYGNRDHKNILIGTLVFGTAVVAVHFVAMTGTHFVEVAGATPRGVWLSNEVLAFGVTLSSFVISGAFLLVGVTFATQLTASDAEQENEPTESPEPEADTDMPVPVAGKLPFEKNGHIQFVTDDEVTAIRAEGRYTFLYHTTGRLFCPWSISTMEKRLSNANFVKCHRSYLINTQFVTGFERKKDNGVCSFDGSAHIDKAPVSRTYLASVRDSLGV